MTLKLVDPDNVTELPVYNFQDMAGCARKFADQLEAGKQGEPIRCVLVAQSDDAMAISVWGESASAHLLMGIFEAAKLRVFADDMLDDD